MKQSTKLLALLGAISMIGAAPAIGAFHFDEFGNSDSGPGFLGPDPTGGYTNGPVLIYNLPFAGTAGDVLMHDGGLAGPFLDVLRFTGAGQLIFYSDNTDGVDSPADTAAPPNPLFPNQANIVEGGVEGGFQDAFYTPGPGQPGFDPAAQPTYDFISDVPEPASATLLFAGLGLFAVRRMRKQKTV